MSTIRVHTTQNVTLEYEIASVGDRIVASFIDYALYVVWFIFCGVLNRYVAFDDVFWFLAFLPTVFYHLACEVFFNGQSLGKKARELRVVRLDGTRAGLGDYFLRWLLRPFEIVMTWGVVGLLTILFNGKGQRLGDLAAGTTVIRLRARPQNGLLTADLLPNTNYQVVFPQAAQLSDHDAALLRQLLSRGVQQENYLLLNEAANKIKAMLGVHTELRDEPFLRTVLRDHAHLMAEGAEPIRS